MKKGKKPVKIYYTDEQRLEYGLACVEKWPHYFKMYCKSLKKRPDDPVIIMKFFGYMKNNLTGKNKRGLPRPTSAMERLGYKNGFIRQYKLQ